MLYRAGCIYDDKPSRTADEPLNLIAVACWKPRASPPAVAGYLRHPDPARIRVQVPPIPPIPPIPLYTPTVIVTAQHPSPSVTIDMAHSAPSYLGSYRQQSI